LRSEQSLVTPRKKCLFKVSGNCLGAVDTLLTTVKAVETLVSVSARILTLFMFIALERRTKLLIYEGWNFNSGNYLFTTDTK